MSEDVIRALRTAILSCFPEAQVDVAGGGGHYTVSVTSTAFAGQRQLQSHQSVYAAIAHLMKGDGAPVHAIDRLETKTPS